MPYQHSYDLLSENLFTEGFAYLVGSSLGISLENFLAITLPHFLSQILGVYTYTRKVTLDEFENKPRKTMVMGHFCSLAI